MLVFAQVLDPAAPASGLAGQANIAAVKDQPVMGVEQVLLGHEFHQLFLDFHHILAGSNASPVADPENMRVDGHGQLTECGIEYHIGGFAADTGQRLQLFAGLLSLIHI